MIYACRECLRSICSSLSPVNQIFLINLYQNYFQYCKINSSCTPSALDFPCYFHQIDNTLNPKPFSTRSPLLLNSYRYSNLTFYYPYSSGAFRSFKKRVRKRLKAIAEPCLDEAKFHQAISGLLPRFSAGELHEVLNLQEDPVVCLAIFNWASQQPRFRHDVLTYHITIKKLGAAKFYQEMDDLVEQLLFEPNIGSEALYNTIIFFLTEARKLTRAAIIFKHMRSCNNLDCRPSIRTYNLLFAAFLSRRSDSYINHMFMATIRSLFKQMVNDGIEPDIFSLNSMIEGYVLSLHVNDALRIFHQMGVVYNCLPNARSYDYLIHGLCAQGRTNNATKLCEEMKRKGFVLNSKSYNSLVNALALGGEVDEAVSRLWEMTEKQRSTDFITYQTVLDQMSRLGRMQEAVSLLKELQQKDCLDGHTYRKLLSVLGDEFGNSNKPKMI